MSYWDSALMAQDSDLTFRVQACGAQELPGDVDVFEWTTANMLRVTAQPGWDAAWSSALASGNEQPGRDPGVITDGMILSGVQAVIGTPPA